MRQALVDYLVEKDDPRIHVLLAGVSNYMFRGYGRVTDVGLREQALVGMASGMALAGQIPIVHTINPFISERALEQVKMAAYNRAPIKICTIGGSFDYAESGPSHHCHSDIAAMTNIPGMEVYWPGDDVELVQILDHALFSPHPTYIRMSDKPHTQHLPWEKLGRGQWPKFDMEASTVIVTSGPLLDNVMEACKGLKVSVLYYNQIKPMDYTPLAVHIPHIRYFVVSEAHGLVEQMTKEGKELRIMNLGLLDCWADKYGSVEDARHRHWLDAKNLRREIKCRL